MIPFITSRTSTWRLLPPRLAGGINGSTCAHSSSVRSLGYRSALRSYRLRFFAVHIGDPSSNQATTIESQMIHWIQFVLGRTLSEIGAGIQIGGNAAIVLRELGLESAMRAVGVKPQSYDYLDLRTGRLLYQA